MYEIDALMVSYFRKINSIRLSSVFFTFAGISSDPLSMMVVTSESEKYAR